MNGDRNAQLRALVDALGRRPPTSADALGRLVRGAAVQPNDLEPWADLEHPSTHSYGRRLVARGPRHEVMVMSWSPGDASAIHDHGGAAWGVVQVFGVADHACFALRDGVLTTRARTLLDPGTLVELDHTTIHQMGNASEDAFVSLHVYASRQDSEDITAGSRVFDTLRGETLHVDGGVFHQLSPTQIRGRTPGLAADAPTEHRDLSDRLQRARRCGDVHMAAAALKRLQAPALQQRLRDHAGR